jgi:hypothetical protein
MTLKQTLGGLIKYARANKEPARVRLPKGLTISVKVDDDLVGVQLARADVYPSTNEWKTVINQWPGQCVVVKAPKAIKDTQLYYLQGQVKIVQQMWEP